MTDERYRELEQDFVNGSKLTREEITEGWHFCCEWDGLLVGPGMAELEPCRCRRKNHPMYKTIPAYEDRPIETNPLDIIDYRDTSTQ